MNYKICIIGTKDTTISLADYIQKNICKIDCIITIDKGSVDTSKISGYKSISSFAEENGIFLFETTDYSLRDEKSKEFFQTNTFDIGICMGWQRLIPQEVLGRFKYGIYGFHGSCGYLPYGRGRSPLNWSIINGDTRFILNMFRYDEKADSPNVYQNRMFEINSHDTIRTLQYKNLLVSYEMSKKLIEDYKNDSIKIKTDSCDFNTLYPKRNPEDGKISFTQKTRDIYNLIRGVTKPFPGAFCLSESTGETITVWEAVPFDSILDFSDYIPGQVIDVLDDMPIVRTIDGSLLIKNFECKSKINKRDILK